MGTFYRGCKLLSNTVVANYNEGKFFNDKTKSMERITDGINKYNVQFLSELKNISADFYTLITTEKIAIKLMKFNSNANQGEIGNLWNLIKSQGGTIRYNRVLRKALKTYGIAKKKLFDELTIEINKEKDRVIRNRQLVLQLLRDYGLGKILDIIEDEHGMNMCEHIKEFTLAKDLDIGIGLNKEDTEELREYYEKLEDEYIAYLRELASKNGMSFDNELSESLVKHRQIVENRHNQIKEEKAQKREDNKRETALASMDKDNSGLFHDINAGCYDKMMRINPSIAEYMRDKLTRLGGKAYYIAVSKYEAVYYIREDGKLTKDIRKANLFKTAEEAEIFYNTVKDTNYEIKISYYRVYALNNPDKVSNITTQEVKDLVIRQQITKNEQEINALGAILSDNTLYDNDKKLVKEILLRTYGYNTNRTDATFTMFKITDKNGKFKFVGVNDELGTFVTYPSYTKALKTITNTDEEERYKQCIINFISDNYKGLTLDIIKTKFDSKWYAERLKEIKKEHNKILRDLNNPDKVIGQDYIKSIHILTNKLNELRNLGFNKVYFIIETSNKNIRDRYSYGLIKYRKDSSVQKRTKDIGIMDLFTSLEEAEKALEIMFDASGSYVSKIVSIDI